MRGIVAGLALLVAGATQGTQVASGHDKPKRQVMSFDNDTIQGDLTRPDGELTQARREAKHDTLIKVRSSFRERALRRQ